jgi:hypothetical protein
MHLKVFLKLKIPKNSIFWANIKKKQKKTKTPQKKQRAGFILTGFFPILPQTEAPFVSQITKVAGKIRFCSLPRK